MVISVSHISPNSWLKRHWCMMAYWTSRPGVGNYLYHFNDNFIDVMHGQNMIKDDVMETGPSSGTNLRRWAQSIELVPVSHGDFNVF